MSEQELSSVEQLDRLLAERAHLNELHTNAPDRLKGAFDVALQGASIKIQEVLATEEIQSQFSALTAQRDADVAVITDLHERGFLTDEQRDEQLAEVFGHPDYEDLRIIAIAQKIGGVNLKETVEVVESNTTHQQPESTSFVAETETIQAPENVEVDSTPSEEATLTLEEEMNEAEEVAQAEVEKERIPTLLTIIELPDRADLKVGLSRGKRYPLSERKYSKQKDYTQERKLFVEIISAKQGDWVTYADIVSEFEQRGITIDKSVTSSIRKWMEKIEFYGKPVFEHNNQKQKSAYRTNPELDITLSYKKVAQRIQKTTTQVKHDLAVKKPSRGGARKPVEHSQTIEDALNQGAIPLRESAILMSFMRDNADLLEILGIKAPDSAMVDEISNASFQEDIKANINRTSVSPEALKAERTEVAKQFRVVFNTTELFDQFVDNIPETNTLYPMVEYLLDIDDEQWDTLVHQVLQAHIRITDEFTSDGHNGTNPSRTITLIKLPNGKTFRRETNMQTKRTILEEVDFTRQYNEDQNSHDEVGSTPETTSDTPQPLTEQGVKIQRDTKTTKSSPHTLARDEVTSKNERAEWKDALKKDIGEALLNLEKAGAIFEGKLPMKKVRLITSGVSIRIGTKQSAENLVKFNLLNDVALKEQQNHEIGLRETVLMMIFNSNRTLFDNKTRSREALELLDSSLESFMQAWKHR